MIAITKQSIKQDFALRGSGEIRGISAYGPSVGKGRLFGCKFSLRKGTFLVQILVILHKFPEVRGQQKTAS